MRTPLSASLAAALICLLSSASSSYSQALSGIGANDSDSQKASAPRHAAKTTDRKPTTQVLYSGRLMGYFRVPDQQPRDKTNGCIKDAANISDAARAFFDQRSKYPNAILVGTGDNFAPNMEARTFSNASPASGKEYETTNKEHYQWNPDNPNANQWLSPTEFAGTKYDNLRKSIANGKGTIPTDNVGCFLAAAGYAAVVPGKHDFYYGPERLRELARFLASRPGKNSEGAPKDYPGLQYRPVQMLAANLVIKTTWMERKPSESEWPDKKSKPPHWHFPEDLAVMNLSDGARVYPWFSSVRLRFERLEPRGRLHGLMLDTDGLRNEKEFMKYEDFVRFIRLLDDKSGPADYRREVSEIRHMIDEPDRDTLYICPGDGSNPSAITRPSENSPCKKLSTTTKEVRLVGNSLVIDLPFPNGSSAREAGKPFADNDHSYALKPGKNHGLWLVRKPDKDDKENDKDKKKDKENEDEVEDYCIRFSVHIPFLSYPSEGLPADVKTPDPYVRLTDKDDNPVAIFGVVETDLGEHVGLLNFAWQNENPKVRTAVSVEDPAEALRQQLEYFERKNPSFNGMRILLAQMSPSRARVLAARVPGFQVVVSAADQDQDTVRITTDATWSPVRAGESPNQPPSTLEPIPLFYAVPSPFFISSSPGNSVRTGLIELTRNSGSYWKLHSDGLVSPEIKEKMNPAPEFWTLVNLAFHNCERGRGRDQSSNEERLRLLTLCAMQQETRADVALIQKRDMFFFLPNNNEDGSKDAQRILERIIWKGDFLTLLQVPGKSLIKAMALSKKFEEEESAALSLVNETGRKLETLGIREDADNKQYLVNEVAVDPERLYTVVTTDYIGAGDTGYPDLIDGAIDPPDRPGRFPEVLWSISTIACRMLFGNQDDKKKYCAPYLNRKFYLDESAQTPPYSGKGKSFWSRLLKRSPAAESQSTQESVNQRVQFRPLWDRDIRLTVSINALINNLNDSKIDERFSGVTTSSVTAHAQRTYAFQLQTKLSHSLHSQEFFLNPTISYNVQHTGLSDKIEQVNQISNLATVDTGLRFKWPNRALPHLAGVTSIHLESPFISPITTFVLSTPNKDRKQFHQGYGFTVLPRVGLRWQGGIGAIEMGAQGGFELNALEGYRFRTNGGLTAECLASATKSFAKCVEEKSKPEIAAITPDSEPSAIRGHKPKAGAYWKMNFEVPISPIVKYVLDDDGDFFPVNFSTDNATDTRFRYFTRHSVKWEIWKSLSVGPSYRLFLFQNKVNKDRLVQQQFLFEMDLGFDIFNWREGWREVRYRGPAPKH